MIKHLVAAALLIGGASAAHARDGNGAEQIARGDYAAAERVIVQSQRLFPHDTDLLINLATVYARTGRVAEARRLYGLAVAQPDEKLDLAGERTRSSRLIALDGLRRLDQQVAALR